LIQSEKPQLSPCLGADFIKNIHRINPLYADRIDVDVSCAVDDVMALFHLCLFSQAFCDNRAQARRWFALVRATVRAHPEIGTSLLNFPAPLTRPARIV
jgi:hypothetical protein